MLRFDKNTKLISISNGGGLTYFDFPGFFGPVFACTSFR
jgi:hypothetical protein